MKRIKALFAILVIGLIMADCSVTYAAETGVAINAGELSIRELSEVEIDAIIGEDSSEGFETAASSMSATRASYTAYEYAQTFDISLDGTWVAQANAKCIVWHYTDGKVHLYNRTITVTRLATYDASRTYGRIVNTDGSLSYTTGDRVHLYGDMATWNFAIDFRVTPTEASFNCYEV